MLYFKYNALWIVINFLVFWFICLNSCIANFKNCPHYITGGRFLFLWWDFYHWGWFWLVVCCCSEVLISSFLHFYFFSGFRFQYSQIIVIFLFPKFSDSFLMWLFHVYRCLSFRYFYHHHNIFFHIKFHSYILSVYTYCLFQDFQ